MRDYAEKRRSRFARHMGGDVRTVLTLLCVGISLASVVFFSYVLWSRDSLIIFVPKDAEVYIHYRRLPWNDYTLLKKAFAIPAHLEPKEAAIFSRQQDKDGELMWSTLLMWDSEDAIRLDERLTLHEIASERLDQRTFLIGDLSVVRHRDQSLAYTERGRAHKAMLSISRAQAIFSPDILVGAGHRNDMLSQTFVASLREKGDTLIASMQTVASIQDDMTPIGMFRTVSGQTTLDFDMPESTIISISSLDAPTFDAMQLLLSDLKDLSTSFGTPLSDVLRDTETELRLLLSNPSTLTLLPDIDGDLQFVLHYPTIEPMILMSAVSKFMQTALPDSVRFTLPDGNRGWELKIDPDAYAFEPVRSVNDAWILATDTGIRLMIAESHSSGSLISTSLDSLKIYLQSDLRAPDTYCGQLRGKAIYFNRSPKNMFAQLDIPGNPFTTLGITDIYVTKTGENSLLFCGLFVDSVDNLEID